MRTSPICTPNGMLRLTPSQKEVCIYVLLSFFILTYATVLREDYARLISADYHKLVDDKTEQEKAANLQKVREWAAARETVADDNLSRKSITSRITSIREKFTSLVCFLVMHTDEHY